VYGQSQHHPLNSTSPPPPPHLNRNLPSQELRIEDASSASNPVKTVRMHPSFRLFATQNPHTGHFKGHRERLSPDLVDRFAKVGGSTHDDSP
jgi:hypothetical protein